MSLLAMRSLLLIPLVLVSFSGTTGAQELKVAEYRARVLTKSGNRLRGILDEVTNEYLYVDHLNARSRHGNGKIPLATIRKVVIRYNQRKNTLEGAIVGGGLAGFLTIQSSKRNGFRSPVIYGLNLAIAVGGGAAIGALVGKNIGPISRRTIRPFGQTPDQSAESLRRQLEPFTYSYQNDVLNRVPK